MEDNYSKLIKYVRRNRINSTFDANTLREKLGVEPRVIGSLVSRAVKSGIIRRIGDVPSTLPHHKGSSVGLYTRSVDSYA